MPFKHILLPLDGSSLAEEAIAHAVMLARRSGAEIHLLHVQKSDSHTDAEYVDPVDWRLRRAELTSYLKRLAGRMAMQNIQVTLTVVEGRPADQIVEYCEHAGIDLVVLTAYGKGGLSRFDFGSTAQKVLSGSGRSFLLLRPGATPADAKETSYRRVLVSMDGTPRSEWVACQVAAMMRGQEAELILLQVIPVPGMPRRMPITREEHATREKFVECNRRAAASYLDEIARQLQNGIKVRPRLLVSQNVAEQIYTTAAEEHADLIAMSAHDWQSDTGQATGNICQTVMSHSNLPVLVFKDLPDAQVQSLQSDPDMYQLRYPASIENRTSSH